MITQVPRESWTALFDAAISFYHLAPWQWMDDDQIHCIVDPVSGKKCYASVMGKMGSYHGLALYLGKDGYKSYLMLQGDVMGTDPDGAMYEQECLIASFEDPGEIDGEDLALIQSMGINVDGMQKFPTFRSYRKGLMPWALDEEEVELLTRAVKQVSVVGEALEDDKAFLTPPKGEEKKVKTYEWEEGEWKGKWDLPDSILDFSPPTLNVSADLIERVGRLPRVEGPWLVERFFFQQPAMDESVERPYFPIAFVFLDMKTQVLCGLDLVHPFQLTQDAAGVLVGLMEEAGQAPALLVVSSKENYILLTPLARALKMELHLEEELDILPDIKAELYRQMQEGED